ncbi:ABC transporter substrate-binding protein [Methylocella sp.]|uniref:ABC transporter substrate-binding protein n=1 Tax=Methylocella sp. TaxID=1978226 RepID=UPI003783A115
MTTSAAPVSRRALLAAGACWALQRAAPAAVAEPRAGSMIARKSAVLPERPQRVVALEFLMAETLALLDRPPVGMSDARLYPGWIGVETDRLKNAVDVGTRQQPSLEAIARLQPDLILGVAYRHAALFDVLAQIAPVVLFEFAPGANGGTQLDSAFETLDILAGITGEQTRAAGVRADAEAAFARDHARLVDAGKTGAGFVLLQELSSPDTYWAFTGGSLAAGLAERLDLRFWPQRRTRDGVRPLQSEELLALENVDVGLISFSGPQATLESKTSSPVWRRTSARREGRVVLIERNIWNFGGVGSAMRLSNAMTGAVLASPTRF